MLEYTRLSGVNELTQRLFKHIRHLLLFSFNSSEFVEKYFTVKFKGRIAKETLVKVERGSFGFDHLNYARYLFT